MRVTIFLTNFPTSFWAGNSPTVWYLYIVENTVGVAWLKSIFFKVSGTGNVRESSSLGSFNNYVDQFWPNFDPPSSRRQLWTFYIISTLCSRYQAWTFFWPPTYLPLLVDVFVEWPISKVHGFPHVLFKLAELKPWMTLCSVLQNTGWFKVKRIILQKIWIPIRILTHLNQINQSCNGSFFSLYLRWPNLSHYWPPYIPIDIGEGI